MTPEKQRADKDLAFMLQYENIAWFDGCKVNMLDRRVYPRKKEFVVCNNYHEVIKALQDMVTQSAGPYTAAGSAMALAAYECKDKSEKEQIEYLEKAAVEIANARPTTAKRMALITAGCLDTAKKAIAEGANTSDAVVCYLVDINNMRYNKVYKMACYLADMVPAHGTVMTQCFGETIVGQLCRALKEQGKTDVRFFCPETRPYFQGARLTATVCHDMGMDVTVITDNMPAFVMRKEHVDVFTSAADAICMDGHVVNKVGTFQIAIAAKYNKIPYFVTGAPDKVHPTIDTVKIEMRDPDFTLQSMGVRTADDGVKGYYPAFDITPPELVSGVVTDTGIYTPYDLERYYKDGNMGEYEMVI
jgi:methylthioribose-1-phosphate isomerase